jgi:hypothetical protein
MERPPDDLWTVRVMLQGQPDLFRCLGDEVMKRKR